MNKFNIRILFFILFVVFSHAAISEELYFASREMEEDYHALLKEIRCVTCANQTLSDSSMPVAMGMKAEIYQQLSDDKSPEEIKNFFVERYGQGVLYRPPFVKSTMFLWLSPIFFILIVLGVWRKVFKSGKT